MPDPQPTRDPAREEAQRAATDDVSREEVGGAEDEDFVAQEADRAGADAARIGGSTMSGTPSDEPVDEAHRPLEEAGEGESEGFEQAEQELIDHASHGDQHAARRAIEDAPFESDDRRANEGGEADFEPSSETEKNW